MGFFDFFRLSSEKRDNGQNFLRAHDLSAFGANAGVSVTKETSLGFSAVYACVRIISESIASLPINVYLEEADGDRISQKNHPVYKLLAKNLYLYPKKYSGEIFNAGTNIKYKIKDIVKSIFIYTKKENQLKKIFKKIKNNKTKGELSAQYMDYKKLNKYFGWKPKYKFSNTLPELIEWYKKYFLKN